MESVKQQQQQQSMANNKQQQMVFKQQHTDSETNQIHSANGEPDTSLPKTSLPDVNNSQGEQILVNQFTIPKINFLLFIYFYCFFSSITLILLLYYVIIEICFLTNQIRNIRTTLTFSVFAFFAQDYLQISLM